jgi:hypothetical protein
LQTTQKTRAKKPKIDFASMAAPKAEKPRTLAECLAEAGGFPFAARAVAECPAPATNPEVLPVGTEMRFDEESRLAPGYYRDSGGRSQDLEVDSTVRRWALLGHRT